jgi:hypothetical protein
MLELKRIFGKLDFLRGDRKPRLRFAAEYGFCPFDEQIRLGVLNSTIDDFVFQPVSLGVMNW